MEPLIIKGTYDTPEVVLDPVRDIFSFSGRSYPEDTAEFYIPILSWVNQYAEKPNKKTHLVFKLDYFNSSSYKPFLDIMVKFREVARQGNEVLVEWQFKQDDVDIKEAGEEFAEIVGVPFLFRKL